MPHRVLRFGFRVQGSFNGSRRALYSLFSWGGGADVGFWGARVDWWAGISEVPWKSGLEPLLY